MSDQGNDNVFFLKGITDELSGENKKLNESTNQLTVLTEKLNRELEALRKENKENQQEFQKDVFTQIESASNQLATRAYEAFTERSLKEANASIKSLKELSFKVSAQISEASKKTKFCLKKLTAFVVAGSVLGGLIGGGVGGTIMRYFPKLDEYVEERYTWGRALERSWKELSKKEQDRIQKLLTKHN